MNNPDTNHDVGVSLPIAGSPHFCRGIVQFPSAWVLHCVYSEYDDDLESQSLSLGLGGIHLLAYFVSLATTAHLLVWPDLWWETSEHRIFQAVVLLAPAMAVFGLLAVLSMTSSGSFILRLAMTMLSAMVLVLLVAITELTVYGDYSFTIPRRWQAPDISWPSILVVVLAWTFVVPLLIALPGVVARVWNRPQSTNWKAKLAVSALLLVGIGVVPVLVAVCANQANRRLWDFRVSIFATLCFLSGLIVSVWLVQWRRQFRLLPAGAQWDSNMSFSSFGVVHAAGLLLACMLANLPPPESTQWPVVGISQLVTVTLVGVTLVLGWTANRMKFRIAHLVYKLALVATCFVLVYGNRDVVAKWNLSGNDVVGIAILFGVGGAVGWLLAQWMVVSLLPNNRRRWLNASMLGFGAILGESALLLAGLAALTNWVSALAALNICLSTACIVVGVQTALWEMSAKWLKACGWSVLLVDRAH